MSIRPKLINNGTPVSSPDVIGVTFESTDYILPINFEEVLDESLYSETVYAQRVLPLKGYIMTIFQNLKQMTRVGPLRTDFFIVLTATPNENRIFQKKSYVGAGTRFLSTDSPKT